MRCAMLLLVTITLLVGYIDASNPVVGVDFGSDRIKTALVRPGTGFHIVVDEQSARAVPAVVNFDVKQRSFGNDATSMMVRKSKETVAFVHRLVGKNMNSKQVKDLQEYGYPWEFVEIPERNTVGVKVSEQVYSPEELLAMNFEHIKKIATDDTEGLPVKDAVVTVPAWMSQNERTAMLDAAEMAGFNVLALVNQNTAAALQFGIDRKYNESDPAHNVIFYNMGTSGTEVTLAEYTSYTQRKGKQNKTTGHVEIKGMAFDEFLGGATLDDAILKFLVKKYSESHPDIDITTIPRAMAKLRISANKAKKVLSANTETPIFVASIHNDEDFKAFITRQELHDMSQDYFSRVLTPLKSLLEELKMEPKDVDEIIIIGGAVRVPAVKSQLKEFMGKDLAESLNGDEAMALGAVFRAANISTAFKVRNLGMSDVTPYPVGVRFSDIPVEGSADAAAESEAEGDKAKGFSKRAQLFKRFNKLAKRKTVGFSHDNDFVCTMHYDSAAKYLPEGIHPLIQSYKITGLSDVVKDEKNAKMLADGQQPRVALSFSLSSSGIVQLVKAEATLEEEVEVKVPIKPKKPETTETESEEETKEGDDAKKEGGDEKKDGDDEKKEGDDEKKEGDDDKKEESAEGEEKKEEVAAEGSEKQEGDEKKESDEEKKEGDDDKKEETAAEGEDEKIEKEEIQYETKLEKRTRKFALKYEPSYPADGFAPMNLDDIKASKEVLSKLSLADELQVRIAIAKNELESNIFDIRSKIEEEEAEACSTEEQREAVKTLLTDSENWLYDQEDDDDKKFMDRLEKVKDLYQPIAFRVAEQVAREEAIETATKLDENVRDILKEIEANRTWIPEEDRTALSDMLDSVQEFIKNATEAQVTKAAHEEPAWTSTELKRKLPPIAKKAQELLKRQKPKPKKEKKKAKKKDETEGEDSDEKTEGDEKTATDAETGETEKADEAGEREETENGDKKEEKEEKEEEKKQSEESQVEEEKVKEETDSEL